MKNSGGRPKGAKNKQIHWSALDPEGERHYFRSSEELSDWAGNTWGTPPLSRELICRVAKQLAKEDCKKTCKVYYCYGALDIRRELYPWQLLPGVDTCY